MLFAKIDTFVCSATYSSKYVDGKVISPNLSRRRLYTDEMLRDQQASRFVLTNTGSSFCGVYTFYVIFNVLLWN